MKLRAVLLTLMIIWDASLHWVSYYGVEASHFLYPTFPLVGVPYELFWSVFWTAGALIALTLIWGGTTIKNSTTVEEHHHHHYPECDSEPVEDLTVPRSKLFK